jgi:hypothetical protein
VSGSTWNAQFSANGQNVVVNAYLAPDGGNTISFGFVGNQTGANPPPASLPSTARSAPRPTHPEPPPILRLGGPPRVANAESGESSAGRGTSKADRHPPVGNAFPLDRGDIGGNRLGRATAQRTRSAAGCHVEYFCVTESMADSRGSRQWRALSRLNRTMFGADVTATGHDAFDQFRVHTTEPALVQTLPGPELISEHLAGRVPLLDLARDDPLTWQ